MRKHWLFTTLLAIALCVICFTLFPTEANAASVDDLSFKLNDDGQSYTVSDCSESASGALEIPAIYNGKPVTSIGNYAFNDCSSLTSITIPEGVTRIGDEAFYDCESLVSITIPEGVTRIGYDAFSWCVNLVSITIPDSVTSIGGNAFYNCLNLTDVYITDPNAWCKITFIDEYSQPMRHADRLHILDASGNEMTDIVLDATVTAIQDYMFSGCSSLTSITIPDGVTSIGFWAFENCSSLTSITIPDSVTNIDEYAFYNCSSLTSVTIPDRVTSIGSFTFYNCSSLTSVTIPDSVTSIGYYAFDGCSSLTSVTIPDSVINIGGFAFEDCWSLTSITIPDSVTSIGEYAFYDCRSLTSITIPDSVNSIGASAICNCINLCNVYYSGAESNWNRIDIGSSNYSLTAATIHYNHSHDYSLIPAVVVPATCTEAGYTEYTCAYGEKHRADYVPALGHIKGTDAVVVVPTCGSRGYTESTCPRCKLKVQTDYVDSLGHDFSGKETVVAPKCTEEGYTSVQCTRCTEITKKDYVESVGHSMVYKAAEAATCTEDGHTEGTLCSRCGFLGTATKLEKGHIYDANNKCVCGDEKLGILAQPKTAKVKAGSTAKFTVKASGNGLKYQWQSSSNGKTWKNCSSSSAKKATFTFTSKTSHSSNYYRCRVTDAAGNTVYTDAVRLYVLGVTTQPKTQKVEAGEKVKFTVTATGAGKTYQWQVSTNGKTWKNCSSSSAKKATFTFTSKTSHSSNYYRCRIKDNAGNTVYTDAVRLYVLGITEQPVSKTVTKGKTAKFEVEATGASKTYQWQVSTDGGKTWKNCSSSSAKKATFSFTAKTSHNGNYYRCRVKDNGGNTVYTAKVKLTVKK